MPYRFAERLIVIAFRNRGRQLETRNIDSANQLTGRERLRDVWKLLDGFWKLLDWFRRPLDGDHLFHVRLSPRADSFQVLSLSETIENETGDAEGEQTASQPRSGAAG